MICAQYRCQWLQGIIGHIPFTVLLSHYFYFVSLYYIIISKVTKPCIFNSDLQMCK